MDGLVTVIVVGVYLSSFPDDFTSNLLIHASDGEHTGLHHDGAANNSKYGHSGTPDKLSIRSN